MNEDTKQEIQIILNLLKGVLMKNYVSMGVSTAKGGQIMFFDTDTYVECGKIDGFSVCVQDLVRWGYGET